MEPGSPVGETRMREAGARYHSVDLSRFLGWQGHDVFCPAFKRLAHLRRIPSAVIYACNASPMAADVVEDRLHDVWQHAKPVGHDRGC